MLYSFDSRINPDFQILAHRQQVNTISADCMAKQLPGYEISPTRITQYALQIMFVLRESVRIAVCKRNSIPAMLKSVGKCERIVRILFLLFLDVVFIISHTCAASKPFLATTLKFLL